MGVLLHSILSQLPNQQIKGDDDENNNRELHSFRLVLPSSQFDLILAAICLKKMFNKFHEELEIRGVGGQNHKDKEDEYEVLEIEKDDFSDDDVNQVKEPFNLEEVLGKVQISDIIVVDIEKSASTSPISNPLNSQSASNYLSKLLSGSKVSRYDQEISQLTLLHHNFERLLYFLYDSDCSIVKRLMKQWDDSGEIMIEKHILVLLSYRLF